ncbi:MAG: ATP-binding protein [Nitrospinota bacterium]
MGLWMSWSSGKDSAYALSILLQDPKIKVSGIFTSINEKYRRVSMHSTAEELLILQAERLNLPLEVVALPAVCSNELYKEKMMELILKAKKADVDSIGFGDLLLEDIKQYRIKMMEGTNIKPLFPIFGNDTTELAKKLINQKFKAVINSIDEKKLSKELLGSEYNQNFINRLPEGVDHCGENGEFHTFVYSAPIFSNPINIKVGQIVSKDGYGYIDLLLDN